MGLAVLHRDGGGNERALPDFPPASLTDMTFSVASMPSPRVVMLVNPGLVRVALAIFAGRAVAQVPSTARRAIGK